VAGGQISPSPIDFHRRPYNTLALPCERVIKNKTPWDFSSCRRNRERERTGNICCWHVYALSTRDVTNLSPSSSAALTSAAEVKKCHREVASGQHTHLSVENSEVRTEEHRRIRATTTLTWIIISNNSVFSSTPITS